MQRAQSMQQICTQEYAGSTKYTTDMCTGNAEVAEYAIYMYTGKSKEHRVCNKYVHRNIPGAQSMQQIFVQEMQRS